MGGKTVFVTKGGEGITSGYLLSFMTEEAMLLIFLSSNS